MVRPTRLVHLSLPTALLVAALVVVLRRDLGLPISVASRSDEVRMLQWNTDYPAGNDPRAAQAMSKQGADIVLISNRGSITSPDVVRQWAGANAQVAGVGPFALITTMPVVEARPIAFSTRGGQYWAVGRFTVMPPRWNGRPLRIAMVDLPSRPRLPRSFVAAALAEAIEVGQLGPVDVVAGDFNALDHSVIMRRCFPGFRDALAEAGTGWLATWPRRLPLWRIDHVMLGPQVHCLAGWTEDPGTSEHMMTMVRVVPVDP
jgi:endonuclease/exonuclease/phosphatase (EEP) superfamily protein YafD